MRTRTAAILLLSLANMLTATPLPPEVPIGDSLDHIPTQRLLADLESTKGQIRLVATRELFRRNHRVQGELKAAGAQNLFTAVYVPQPTRRDMIFSLIEGVDIKQVQVREQFRLVVEEGVTDEDVARLGRRHGFAATSKLSKADDRPAKSRVCTCKPTAKDPVATDRAVYLLLVEEPHVITAEVGVPFVW
jgi:hypothetical protein